MWPSLCGAADGVLWHEPNDFSRRGVCNIRVKHLGHSFSALATWSGLVPRTKMSCFFLTVNLFYVVILNFYKYFFANSWNMFSQFLPRLFTQEVLDVDFGNEKRRVPRTNIKWSVTIQTSKGAISSETHDISVEGAFIRAWNPSDFDEFFKIFIKVPNLNSPLLADAQVVWTRNRKSDQVVPSSGIGVKFTQIKARDRTLLNEAISTHPYPGNMS